MIIFYNTYDKIENTEDLTITMGNFDGLHLGHQQLINRVLRYKDTKHAILTFDPHPSEILRKKPFRTLTQKRDKIELFSQYPLDYAIIVKFDEAFSKLNVMEFINFLKSISVKRLVIGRDARFAYRGIGDINELKKYFVVDVLDDLVYNHTRVSTTYVKDFLIQGDLGSARKLLNRHYQIYGTVMHGHKIGRGIGYPTANIDFGNYYLPRMGVYYVKILVNNKTYHAMANIGNNPTINFSEARRLEIFILDFDQDIYDKRVAITFLHYLRPEYRFPSKDALIVQLKKDEQMVRSLTKL
ncbi:MAG: bifunctional riboflavin kinase/FAD synthetase [Acholeplasmataceae bacterium]|nr:bifunctional riboflavin kinase/FAD synthetase [Acholeplasmataceae bacterium]